MAYLTMKKLTLVVALFGTLISSAQKGKPIPDSAKFNKYVAEKMMSFHFTGQQPVGTGWDILEKHFADNQFVAWGEYHNSPLLSRLAGYALAKASRYGFKTWCIETSPFVAAELTRIGKSKAPADTIAEISKGKGVYGTFPFFKTREDAEMLVTASRYHYNIWGIDQEYQMAFSYCLEKVYQAQPAKIKASYKGVYDSLVARWWMPEVRLLDSLKKAISQPVLKKVLDDITLSRTIYYEDDALLRATLMKNNFYNYYDHSPARNEKVFFKMGANHLAKGLNLMTHLYDMGNAAFELSQRNKTNFTNVFFVNRFTTEKGKVIDDLASEENEYPREFLKLYDSEKWMVVDVRPLRNRLRADKTLTEDTYQIIYKYDFIVVSPEVKP